MQARVLFLNDTSRNGGPGRSLQTLLGRLDPGRIHRAVLLPRPGEIADLLRSTGAADAITFEPSWVENIVEPWHRPMERGDFQAGAIRRTVRAVGNVIRMGRAFDRIRRLIKREKHQLLYCNGTTASFMGAALGFFTRVPVLWHVRYSELPPALLRFHDRLAASSVVGRIVCVSRPAAALFERGAGKVQVIPNGVDTTTFSPAPGEGRLRGQLGLPAGTVIFGSHGRILRKKGYVEMLMAAKMCLTVLRQHERPLCHFLIVGDTPQDFQPDHLAECRRLAATLGIQRQVTFTGFRADVRPFLREIDVAVVPSVYPDPLPRAVLESMAMARPVVAFDVGGVAEMLAPEQGKLVPGNPPDVEQMALTFVRYFRDPDLRERQGKAARARVLRDFDARAHAERIEAQIQELIGPAAAARVAA